MCFVVLLVCISLSLSLNSFLGQLLRGNEAVDRKWNLDDGRHWLFAGQIYGMENGTLNFHGRLQDVKEFNPELFTVWQEKIKRARSGLGYFQPASLLIHMSNDERQLFYWYFLGVEIQMFTTCALQTARVVLFSVVCICVFVCLDVCLSVCWHDNSWTVRDIITKFLRHRNEMYTNTWEHTLVVQGSSQIWAHTH